MLRPFETGQIIQADNRNPFAQIRPEQSLGAPQTVSSSLGMLDKRDYFALRNPNTQMPSSPVGQPIQSAGGFTLAGMAQQPMQNPLGGGLSSLNQQPFSTSLQPQQFGMNQQPQQINGGIRSLLDSYIGNYINNYFKNALR